MNFMGMGIPEVGVILLVAFLVLGPGRSIDMAKNAGKLLGDLRRSFNEVTSAVSVESQQAASRPAPTQQDTAPVDEAPGVPMRPDTPVDDGPPEPADKSPGTEDKG